MFRKLEYYTQSAEKEITPEVIGDWISKHREDCRRFSYLRDMYEGRHPILIQPPKPEYKPDNRIVTNFAKYIVDTLNGYFIGIPVKTEHPDESVREEMEIIEKSNDQDDSNAELAKICSIYGSGFELLYTDSQPQIRTTYLTPLDAFLVYDDTVAREPLFGVRYYKNSDGETVGSIYTKMAEIPFSTAGGIHFYEEKEHFFGDVPLIEYIENEERQGAFEQVESAITAYEKAISEKANDVDYFADAYLLLIGVDLDEEELYTIRSDRVIHVGALDADVLSSIRAEFMQKPSSDTTQENFLNRVEKLIFSLSMVANISDEDFGGSSGTALAYKLQPMKNLAVLKSRKFASGMNQRWKRIASHPLTKMQPDAWKDVTYHFTQNAPKNQLEEAQTASQMSGITSKRTQLSVLSAVDNVQAEIDEIEKETAVDDADSYRAERVGDEQE